MSPTIYREDGYRFYFFSNEEDREHVHISCGHGEAKFWLMPSVSLANSWGLNGKQLRKLTKIVEVHQNEFISEWQKFFA